MATVDNQKLRHSHIKLGDDINPYQTTAMIQNKFLETEPRVNTVLDQNAKNDLRRNHFVFGHAKPNFETTFRAEYYDKSKLLSKDGHDNKNIGKLLRAHNYEFGDDKPDYISEHVARFKKPVLSPKEEKKISPQLLQQSHCVFGGDKQPWNTTQKRSYTPKYSDVPKISNNLMKTNFVFGDDKSPTTSINTDAYRPFPYQFKPVDPEYLNYLHAHHYQFGKPNQPELSTEYKTGYVDPGRVPLPSLDTQALKKTHFQMGDAVPVDIYNTTYNIVHTPKNIKYDKNVIPKNNLNIKGNETMTYLTDYRDNYIPLKTEPIDYDKNKMVGLIKDTHFNFGENEPDFNTTNRMAYKYNPDAAKKASPGLGKDLLKELKSTHYKLGYDNDVGITTQKKDFVPFGVFDVDRNKGLRKDNFDLGDKYNNKFEGETIYTTDYVEKEIPNNGNDCWC